jgi:hypothetical protein
MNIHLDIIFYRINTPVTVDLVLNDVRPPRSEKLKFWFELALRWTTDKSKIKNQVSLTGFMQPGDFSPFRQQTYVMTYPGCVCVCVFCCLILIIVFYVLILFSSD